MYIWRGIYIYIYMKTYMEIYVYMELHIFIWRSADLNSETLSFDQVNADFVGIEFPQFFQ